MMNYRVNVLNTFNFMYGWLLAELFIGNLIAFNEFVCLKIVIAFIQGILLVIFDMATQSGYTHNLFKESIFHFKCHLSYFLIARKSHVNKSS